MRGDSACRRMMPLARLSYILGQYYFDLSKDKRKQLLDRYGIS
jgi:hypothetical protein